MGEAPLKGVTEFFAAKDGAGLSAIPRLFQTCVKVPHGQGMEIGGESDLQVFQAFHGKKPRETLLWQRRDSSESLVQKRLADAPEGFSWCVKEEAGSEWTVRFYLLQEGSAVSLIRSLHTTPNTVEVYVETLPQLREHGLATVNEA